MLCVSFQAAHVAIRIATVVIGMRTHSFESASRVVTNKICAIAVKDVLGLTARTANVTFLIAVVIIFMIG